ncbi:hypothetical protein [Bacillus sp. T33-2]|uniref:hypothetical protein n=1 Tax=Bacillus sp. T33-2 TaxID=2054168 RepID=UPI000C756A8D|nr:hypothetical protein [Bacillus sp. T33-2]PLR89863.1 hypothetical protein CVD19_23185 [Bacillus sp. T33-2]
MLVKNVKVKSADAESSTTDLASIIEEASAGFQQMSATVETINEDNVQIAQYMDSLAKSSETIRVSFQSA